VGVAALALAPGLALGSFLNVVVARVPLRRSVVHPPSACMECGQEIAWYDNVPVVSWLLLRGRCRNCGTGISARYPLVELLSGLLVAACFWVFGFSADAFIASFFCLVIVTLAAIDLDHRIIPNRIVLPAAVVVLAAQTIVHPSPEWAIAAVGASGFLLLSALAYPAGMGMGDVKLALLLGAMLGRTVPIALFLGMLIALVPGVVLLIRHGSKGRKMGVPLAPFLGLGSLIALFWGDRLLDLWLH
jgi:leader peptidase (prepilin peptidase)/N-methyltransferase